MLWLRSRRPIQNRGADSPFRKRFGNLIAVSFVGFREFPLAALPDRLRKLALQVAEEWERGGRTPFLPHEQERRHWRQQRNCKRRGEGLLIHIDGEAIAEGSVADLVVVLKEVHERERREI